MDDSVYLTSFELPGQPDLKRGDVVHITDEDGVWEFLIDDIQPPPSETPLQEEPHVLYGRAKRVE